MQIGYLFSPAPVDIGRTFAVFYMTFVQIVTTFVGKKINSVVDNSKIYHLNY
jgi:hypothetical protein